MRRKRTLLLFTVFALTLFLFSGCVELCTTEEDGSDLPQSQNVALWAAGIDTVTLDGEPVTQDDFKGNTLTVMNFWATWCGPCVRELPELQAVNEKFKDKDVEIVGVLYDGVTASLEPDNNTIASAKALMGNAGASYKVILPDTTLEETFGPQLGAFPTTYFIDADGNVVHTVINANTAEDWEKIINEVLDQIS